MKVDIGISEPNREAIADGLSRLLADSYTLYLKTHNYHWNVTGPMFATLHTLFETHYTERNVRVIYSNFKWNLELPPALFDVKLPKGFALVEEDPAFPVQVGSEADIKDPLIKRMVKPIRTTCSGLRSPTISC